MILACFWLAGIGSSYIVAIALMSIFLFIFNYLTVFVGKVIENNIIYFQEFFTIVEINNFRLKEKFNIENDSRYRNVKL